MAETIANTEHLLVRTIDDNDYATVCSLFKEGEIISKYLNDPEFLDMLLKNSWKEITGQNIFNGLIFLAESSDFCGRVCIQNIDDPIPELGIDVLKKYQNKGYGPEAITAFANWYGKKFGIDRLKVRIWKSNSHSAHVFEKLGARYEGQHPYFSKAVLQAIQEKLPEFNPSELEADGPLTYYLDLPITTA